MGSAASATKPGMLVAARYEIQLELARGGMGVVYRAYDRVANRPIALKRSLEEGESTELKRSMLQREYQTLVTLRHPRIIEVYDFGTDELGPYYTMELLDGMDLKARCPMPWREVCTYLRDVASSLALLHSRRLLHCDVGVANVRLTSEGRAKLIDFGALCTFGRNPTVAGTPPTTAPEVLDGLELDQRVDLYALGATAYFALTGQHAYPAAVLSLLRPLWARGRPEPPSALADDIPRDLDDLVLDLLSLDRMSRPASAEEVIDRLGAIAGLSPDHDQRVVRSYLFSAHLIGRDAERKELRNRLTRAASGRGGGVLIEGASGLGKSSLLNELTHEARVAGGVVLFVNARAHTRAFGLWSALAHQAAEHVPEAAEAVLAKLRFVSPSVPPRGDGSVSIDRSTLQSTDKDHLTQLQGAIEACFTELAERAPVLIAIDDLHAADTNSLASFAALARVGRRSRILLAGAIDDAPQHSEKPVLQLMQRRVPRIELRPFDAARSQEFVSSIFGEVPSAPRLAGWLHDHAAGNPSLYVELVTHLIEQGQIRFAEGTWIIPHELPSGGELKIDALVDSALENRLARWSPQVRCLAECLSPYRYALEADVCRLLAEDEPTLRDADIAHLLDELVREGVLIAEEGAYAFSQPRIRSHLYRSLGQARRQRKHLCIAEALRKSAAPDDARSGLEVGFHFLLAGDEKKAYEPIATNMEAVIQHPDTLIDSLPELWALVDYYRKDGACDEDLLSIEGMLVVSGFYIDPTVQDRYGERIVKLLADVSGFTLAARLTRWLGSYVSLMVGLLSGWFLFWFRKWLFPGQSFATHLLMLCGTTSSMSAVACFRLDRKVHPQLLEHLAVAKNLGRHNGLRLVYDLVHIGALITKGRFAEAHVGLEDQLVRLPHIMVFTDDARHQYEAALLFFIGRSQLQRLGSDVLGCADRIDALGGRHDRLMAQFLRRAHHLYRGDLAAVKSEEERLDDMAARIGSRWAPDLLTVLEFIPYHLSGDVLGLKRTLHRIERLVPTTPGLETHREVVRAMYEGHRGRPERALAIYESLDAELAPFVDPVWASARAHQAECLNALERHDEALAVCTEALAHIGSAARVVVFAYMQLEREAALALSGLGRREEAAALCDELLALCDKENNPLLIGILHHDRARIACAARDKVAFERHAEAAREAFADTKNPALIARGSRLAELGRAAGLFVPAARPSMVDFRDATIIGTEQSARAARALREVVKATGARGGYLYLVLYGKAVLCARHGEMETTFELDSQIATLVRSLDDDDVSDELVAAVLARVPNEVRARIKFLPLLTSTEGERHLVGILALADCGQAENIDTIDLSQLALQLSEADEVTDMI